MQRNYHAQPPPCYCLLESDACPLLVHPVLQFIPCCTRRAALRKQYSCQALKSRDVLEMCCLCSFNPVHLQGSLQHGHIPCVHTVLTQLEPRIDAQLEGNYSVLGFSWLCMHSTQLSSLHTFHVLLQGKNEGVLPLQTGILLKGS